MSRTMRERVALGVFGVGLAASVALGCGERGELPTPSSAKLALGSEKQPLELPAPPATPPAALSGHALDRDGNKLDDAIDAELVSMSAAPGTPASLDDAIPVSVFFEAPVTAADVSAFQAKGGSVRRFYKKLAYGFQHTESFHRAFKRWTGKPPRSYRSDPKVPGART